MTEILSSEQVTMIIAALVLLAAAAIGFATTWVNSRARLAEARAAADAKVAGAKAEAEAKQATHEVEYQAATDQALLDSYAKLWERFEALTRDVGEMRERERNALVAQTKLQTQIEGLTTALTDARVLNRDQERRIGSLEGLIRQKLAEWDAERASMTDRITALETQLTFKSAAQERALKGQTKAENLLAAREADYDKLKADYAALEAQHTALAAQVAALETENAAFRDQVSALQLKLDAYSRTQAGGG